MEKKLSVPSHDPKRKAEKEESSDSTSLYKKARHGWQIKGAPDSDDVKALNQLHQHEEYHGNHVRTVDYQEDVPQKTKYKETSSSVVVSKSVLHQAEIRQFSSQEYPAQSVGDSPSSSVTERKNVYLGVLNGHQLEIIESQKERGETCINSDGNLTNNHLQTADNHFLPEFELVREHSETDTNIDSTDSTFGRPSCVSSQTDPSSNGSGGVYTPHSSVTSQTDSNQLHFDSFLARRQNSHIAKAVVDNAINKTLEDMGVAPDTNSDGSEFVTGKCRVEDAGISQAIQTQGLVPRSIPSQAMDPILSHVTHLSDMMFSQRRQIFQPEYLSVSRDLVGPNSSYAAAQVSPTVSSSDLLDQAVSMAISSRGLALQRDVL